MSFGCKCKHLVLLFEKNVDRDATMTEIQVDTYEGLVWGWGCSPSFI